MGAACLAGTLASGACGRKDHQQRALSKPPTVTNAVASKTPTADRVTGRAADPESTVQVQMRNVNFHLDETIVLHISELRGRMIGQRGLPPVFDDKHSYTIAIEDGEIAISTSSLTDLMNTYALSSPDSPLKRVRITTEGGRIRQTGVARRGIGIPFSILADVDVTPAGNLRLTTEKIKMAGVPAAGLLHFFGLELDDLLELEEQHGLSVEGDTFIVDPARLLPAPRIQGRLASVRVERDRLVQVYARTSRAGRLSPPVARANYMYYRGGVLRFGRLTMTDADMQIIDADPSDPFDFYPDRYTTQLIAGHSKSTPSLGLKVFMPDYDDLRPNVKREGSVATVSTGREAVR